MKHAPRFSPHMQLHKFTYIITVLVVQKDGNLLIPFTDDYSDFTISKDGTVILGDSGWSRPDTLWHFDVPLAPESLGLAVQKEEVKTDDGTWTCPNGHEGNTGKFCTECGSPKPEDNGPWTCVNGHEGNTGKFCSECGSPKP